MFIARANVDPAWSILQVLGRVEVPKIFPSSERPTKLINNPTMRRVYQKRLAKNLSKYFDIRGFIVCENIKEIKYAINKMSDEDYISKKEYIKKNKQTALYHADFKKRAAQIIKDSILK